MLNIRLAVASDSPKAVSVIREVYDEYGFSWDESDYHADLYDIECHYVLAGHFFWICEIDDQAIGTCALHVFPPIPGGLGEIVEHEGFRRIGSADCSLERLYVRPSARRLGAGKALFKTAIEMAKSQGRQAMEIWSDKRFEQAHALYNAMGSITAGDRICHDPDQSPEWGLYLPLTVEQK